MKTYIDVNNSYIKYEETFIPKDSSNRFYRLFLEEQTNGTAELIPYVPPEPTWDEIILKRNILLKESEPYILLDGDLENRDAWLNYRNILHNITLMFSSPSQVIWPISPIN